MLDQSILAASQENNLVELYWLYYVLPAVGTLYDFPIKDFTEFNWDIFDANCLMLFVDVLNDSLIDSRDQILDRVKALVSLSGIKSKLKGDMMMILNE